MSDECPSLWAKVTAEEFLDRLLDLPETTQAAVHALAVLLDEARALGARKQRANTRNQIWTVESEAYAQGVAEEQARRPSLRKRIGLQQEAIAGLRLGIERLKARLDEARRGDKVHAVAEHVLRKIRQAVRAELGTGLDSEAEEPEPGPEGCAHDSISLVSDLAGGSRIECEHCGRARPATRPLLLCLVASYRASLNDPSMQAADVLREQMVHLRSELTREDPAGSRGPSQAASLTIRAAPESPEGLDAWKGPSRPSDEEEAE